MLPETVRSFCLQMKGVTESFPFNEDTLVFMVQGKMFLLLSLEARTLNVKCDPETAISLREQYSWVTPGYHMSKVHWNTVDLNGPVPERLVCDWITDSYHLVVASLPRRLRSELEA